MPKKKHEYTVVGNHAVHGHEPGSTFSSDISDENVDPGSWPATA